MAVKIFEEVNLDSQQELRDENIKLRQKHNHCDKIYNKTTLKKTRVRRKTMKI